jgi:divalent metal cation (Fe/Co/Zn/Cd) transporter
MVRVMRHLMNLIVSVGLIYAGVYVLYEELFVSYSGIHGRYQPFGIGLILFGSGVVWLWWYLVGPIVLKRLTREK